MNRSGRAPRPRIVTRAVLALALLAGLALSGAAEDVGGESGGFQGQVTDILTRQPLAGALVSAGASWATTDADGRYTLRLGTGLYEVGVRAEGYIGMSMTRQAVTEATLTTVDFEMVPASPSAEQRAALDEIFAPSAGPQLTQEELEALRAADVSAAGVRQLPPTIRVVMPDGVVVAMSLDEYIKGVVPREMPPYWPLEALKAQAVAARCYAANARRHVNEGAEVCTTEHCQVWGSIHYDTTDRAVDETHNVAATHSGMIISAFFFAHCDGHTRNSEDVWTVPLSYCRSVSCPCGFTSLYGHGVGMCQYGARVLAEQGKGFAEILMHYYTDVQVTRVPGHSLSEARVTPQVGDTATVFSFEVLYTSHDAPIASYLYIDGHTYAMTAYQVVSQDAKIYRYQTALSAGSHEYAFHFENGYDTPVNLPSSGTLQGPVVQPGDGRLPTPTPPPTPGEVVSVQWAQSTILDFAEGNRFNTVLSEEGDGAVALAPGGTFGVYTSTVKLSSVEFVAVGSAWQSTTPAGTAITITLRSSVDGSSWSDWLAVPRMDAEREESRALFGELVYLHGPYVQYQLAFSSYQAGVTPVLLSLVLSFIDSRAGPTALEAQAVAIAGVAPGELVVIPRSAWGADESLFSWPPEYRTPRKFIIHHTVTPNDDLDPASTVRAIYYYHAVTRGWGDIGYNYLIDARGRIYEGRKGGEGVVGGHAKQYAWGSIGVSLIGNYEEANVSTAMENALVEFLAWKGNAHFIQPTGYSFFIDQHLPNIFGHRDVSQTACPGRYAYGRLPAVREAVLRRMAQLPPRVRIDAPSDGVTLGGVANVLATASPAVNRVELYVDGELLAADSVAPYAWKWNSTTASQGRHNLRVTARTALGLTAEHGTAVTVDNTPPTGSIGAPAFTNTPTVLLTTSANEAQWMQFSNGWHWEGEDLRHQMGRLVTDPEAWNGQAWMGRAGSDGEGWWYGPYFQQLPVRGEYRAYFRLKTGDNRVEQAIADIDVSDDLGRNTYAIQTLSGLDFASTSYQEPYVDFSYTQRDVYGLEFRTLYTGKTDVHLDRVYVFSAPQAYANSAQWTLPEGDGVKEVSVRYGDAAGNITVPYSATIVLDTEPPLWLGWDGARVQVRDTLSGLDVGSAQFMATMDGGVTWGDWQPIRVAAPDGTTDTVSLSAPANGFTHVRFRVSDRAANVAESPAYELATPTATVTQTPVATATTTRTPTPTPTTAAESGTIRGRVILQGRTQHSGAAVSISDAISATTLADGSYVLSGLAPGLYSVSVRMPGYVEARKDAVAVSVGGENVLPQLTLRGGDVNGDCDVDLLDLVTVAANLGTPPGNERADINADGCADLRDLVLVSINLSRSCPGPW